MKCVVIEKPNKVVYTERELGALPRDFARVKVMAAAICATDLEVVDGNIPANYPLTPGHEWAGIVTEVADEKYAHWVGKRVTGSNDVSCRTCEACRSGNWRYCKEFEEIGFRRHGAYAAYIDVAGIQVAEQQLGHDGSVQQVHHRHDLHQLGHIPGKVEELRGTAVAVEDQNAHHQAQGIHTPHRSKTGQVFPEHRSIKAGCP